MAPHFFLIEDPGLFLANLEARHYSRSRSDSWIVYSKVLSNALIKYYGFAINGGKDKPTQIRVSYELIKDGKSFEKLIKELKDLNYRYRLTLPGWKTKREPNPKVRESRWADLQRFFHRHAELIACFKFEVDERTTEGNYLFNLQVASTPKHQKLCMEFVRVLAESLTPHGIVRGRREADKPVQQRNGWIRRYAQIHKKRGWPAAEIAREIQKELRNGTWNERSRLQYNIANNTICKIAGIKIPHSHWN